MASFDIIEINYDQLFHIMHTGFKHRNILQMCYIFML